MFYRKLYQENINELLGVLSEEDQKYLLEIAGNSHLMCYFLEHIITNEQTDQRVEAISLALMAQALSSNINTYESFNLFYTCIHLDYFKDKPIKLFQLYICLFNESIVKSDYFFRSLFLEQIEILLEHVDKNSDEYLLYKFSLIREAYYQTKTINREVYLKANHLAKQCNTSDSLHREMKMYLNYYRGLHLRDFEEEFEDSLQHLSEAFDIAEKNNYLDILPKIALVMSKNYDDLRNPNLALSYYKKYYLARQINTKKIHFDLRAFMFKLHNIEVIMPNASMFGLRNNHLSNLSELDRLSGLHNRMWFERQLDELTLAQSDRYNNIAIVYMDIDWFSEYNTHYGHIKGDQAIQEIGHALRLNLALEDFILARHTSDHFALGIFNTTKEDAIITAKQILAFIRKLDIEHRITKNIDILTISLGVSIGTLKQSHIVFNNAQKGCLAAKKNGKNRVAFHATKKGE